MYDRPRLFIDGEWTDPAKGTTYEVIEAATGEAFATTALATAEDVDAAVAAARAALSGPWSRMTPSDRAQLLGAFAAALGARRKETAALVTRENGMPISLSHVVNGIAPGFITGYYA